MSNGPAITTVVLDLGYGYTKLAALNSDGLIVGPVACPSAYARAGRITTERAQKERARIALEHQTYYWGEHVRFSRDPIYSRERKRPPDMLRVLLLGLLSETEIQGPVRVLTGLPVEWLADADRVREALRGEHLGRREDLVAQGENARAHTIVDVQAIEVFPQPQCAFFKHAAEDESLWQDWVTALIVDVGTGTVNVSFIDGGVWIDERARSIAHGMGHVLEQALQKQERLQGGRDSLLTARAKLWAGDAEITEYARDPIAQLAGHISGLIGDVVGDALVTGSILCGGGARFVAPHLTLPGKLLQSEAPEFDNVYGLLEIAREGL